MNVTLPPQGDLEGKWYGVELTCVAAVLLFTSSIGDVNQLISLVRSDFS